MHKTTGIRDPAAALPLPGGRDDAADRRAANRAAAVSAAGLAVTGVVELLLAVVTGSVGLPAARRGLLLARTALAAGDHRAAQEQLQAAALGDLTPRRALVHRILLAAAAIERGDPMAANTVA